MLEFIISRDKVNEEYITSWLAVKYKEYSLSFGIKSINKLLDNLGRKTLGPEQYQLLLTSRASTVALDGHVIPSASRNNDLADKGYKFRIIKSEQVNLMMGYDINLNIPLFSKFYRGSTSDSNVIEDLYKYLHFHGILFVMDRGFYSEKNLNFLANNDNYYIIPLLSTTSLYADVMKKLELNDYFYYHYNEGGKRKAHARVRYQVFDVPGSTDQIMVFLNVVENEKERYKYNLELDKGTEGFTEENLKANENFLEF